MSNHLSRTRKPSNYRLAMPMNVCPVRNNDSADCNLLRLSILNVINKSVYIINDYTNCSRSAVRQQQMQICDIQFLTAVSPGIQILWDVTPCLSVAPSSLRVKASQKQTCYMILQSRQLCQQCPTVTFGSTLDTTSGRTQTIHFGLPTQIPGHYLQSIQHSYLKCLPNNSLHIKYPAVDVRYVSYLQRYKTNTGVLISPQQQQQNFCKPLKKNQKVVRPTRSPRQQ